MNKIQRQKIIFFNKIMLYIICSAISSQILRRVSMGVKKTFACGQNKFITQLNQAVVKCYFWAKSILNFCKDISELVIYFIDGIKLLKS